ncbi:TPA: hypothetical protein ACHS4H_004779, partial [Klebsiella quasipneumoniae]
SFAVSGCNYRTRGHRVRGDGQKHGNLLNISIIIQACWHVKAVCARTSWREMDAQSMKLCCSRFID